MQTEIGKISTLIQESAEGLTPLQRSLERFGQRLGLVIVAICTAILIAVPTEGALLVSGAKAGQHFIYCKGDPLREEQLIFVELQAMIDPPREDVTQPIERAGKAHIRTMMITGATTASLSRATQPCGSLSS